jgi:hypothetical protein
MSTLGELMTEQQTGAGEPIRDTGEASALDAVSTASIGS